MMISLKQGSWADTDVPALRAVPVFTYHSLDESNSVISVAPRIFHRQMQLLRDWGFQGIRLGDLFDAWEGKKTLPRRPVVLTFDDAFRNLWDHALPVLEEMDFCATIFAVAGYCGGTNDWPSQTPGVPRLPLLSWSELRTIAAAGFEIGAHGIAHAPLPTLGNEEAEREITGSQVILQEHLGQPVTVFAYPYGLAHAVHRRIVAAHFQGACGTDLGMASPFCDRSWLPRIEMHYYRAPALFRLFPTRLGPAYLGLRSLGRLCRRFSVSAVADRVLQ